MRHIIIIIEAFEMMKNLLYILKPPNEVNNPVDAVEENDPVPLENEVNIFNISYFLNDEKILNLF